MLSIVAVDLFVIPSIGFKLLPGPGILRLGRRRFVWTNVRGSAASIEYVRMA
jgi:hypothetical protein